MDIPFYTRFYCFTYYDRILKKRFRENNSIYLSAVNRRYLLSKDKRYTAFSPIFVSDLES